MRDYIKLSIYFGIVFVVVGLVIFVWHFFKEKRNTKSQQIYQNPYHQQPMQQQQAYQPYQQQKPQEFQPKYQQDYMINNPPYFPPETPKANPMDERLNQITLQLSQLDLYNKQLEAKMKKMDFEEQEKKFEKSTHLLNIGKEEETASLEEKKKGELLGRVHYHIKLPAYADKMIQEDLKAKFSQIIEPELKSFKKSLKKLNFDVEIEYEVV